MNVSSFECSTMEPFIYIFLSFNIGNVLLFPLFAFILYLFYLQWRPQRSFSRMSHSDYLTMHMTIMNMFSILGSILCLVDSESNTGTSEHGIPVMLIVWYSRMFLHFFSCLDQYLAVVHPVTYIRLKHGKGIRMRHVGVSLLWLMSIVGTMMFQFSDTLGIILEFMFLAFIWISILAFSLIVLCFLKRPRPGKNDERVRGQQKQKAFCLILIILGVLSLKFIWGLLFTVMHMSPQPNKVFECFMEAADWWFSIPSNLILPVMFLLKATKT